MLYCPIYSATNYTIWILTNSVYGLTITLKFNGRYMIISRPSLPITPLKIKQTWMERVHSYRYLGVTLLAPSIDPCKTPVH